MNARRVLASATTRHTIACGIVLAYIAVIAAVAQWTGAFYILFPELGALAYDSITRPHGRWASAPIQLATTPFITAVMGILITRMMPYSLVYALLTVALAFVAIMALRSPIAPAISAGLLPLVIGVKSWGYPGGILAASILLVALVLGWRALLERLGIEDDRPAAHAEERRGLSLSTVLWATALFLFVAVEYGLVRLTGMRFVMFPPVIVICFELLSDPACPWSVGLERMPLLLFTTALCGFTAIHWLGTGAAGAAVAMALGIGVLRIFGTHLPPALAVSLLPMVMTAPTIVYPFAILLGSTTLTLWVMGYQRLLQGSALLRRAEAAPNS